MLAWFLLRHTEFSSSVLMNHWMNPRHDLMPYKTCAQEMIVQSARCRSPTCQWKLSDVSSIKYPVELHSDAAFPETNDEAGDFEKPTVARHCLRFQEMTWITPDELYGKGLWNPSLVSRRSRNVCRTRKITQFPRCVGGFVEQTLILISKRSAPWNPRTESFLWMYLTFRLQRAAF